MTPPRTAAAWAGRRLAVDLALLEASPPARWRLVRRRRWQTLVTTGHRTLAAADLDPLFFPRRPTPGAAVPGRSPIGRPSVIEPAHRLEGIQP